MSHHHEQSFFVKIVSPGQVEENIFTEFVSKFPGNREKFTYRPKILRIFPDGYKLIPEPPKNNYSEVEDMFADTELVRFSSVAKFTFDALHDEFKWDVVRKQQPSRPYYIKSISFKSPQVDEIQTAIQSSIDKILSLKKAAKTRVNTSGQNKLGVSGNTPTRPRTSSTALYQYPFPLEGNTEHQSSSPPLGVKLQPSPPAPRKSAEPNKAKLGEKGKEKDEEIEVEIGKASPTSENSVPFLRQPKARKPRKFVVTPAAPAPVPVSSTARRKSEPLLSRSAINVDDNPSVTIDMEPIIMGPIPAHENLYMSSPRLDEEDGPAEPTSRARTKKGKKSSSKGGKKEGRKSEKLGDSATPAATSTIEGGDEVRSAKRNPGEKLKSSVKRLRKSLSGEVYESV